MCGPGKYAAVAQQVERWVEAPVASVQFGSAAPTCRSGATGRRGSLQNSQFRVRITDSPPIKGSRLTGKAAVSNTVSADYRGSNPCSPAILTVRPGAVVKYMTSLCPDRNSPRATTCTYITTFPLISRNIYRRNVYEITRYNSTS